MKNEIEEFLCDEPVKIIKQEIIIDETFKDRLYPLTNEEYENLKQSIIKESCRDALILWNNTLVDGHNRYSICKEFDISYRTIEKHFNNKNEVLKWIDLNQLSRRNLNPLQGSDLRGRISRENKQEIGGNRWNSCYDKMSQQEKAKELGVNERTLQRDEKFADAIDIIKENLGKDIKNTIINQETKLTKQDVVALGKEDPVKQKELINKIINKEVSSLKEARKVIEIDNRREEAKEVILNNNLHLGGCVDVLKTLESNSVDCVVMDPPYAINYKDTRTSFNPSFEDDPDVILPMLDNCFKELKRVCKDNAHIYCFFGMSEYINFYNLLYKHFGENVGKIPLIWTKNNHTLCDFSSKYALKYEPIFFISNKERKLNYPVSPDVLHYSIPTNKLHQTQKPIDLCEYLICNSTIEGEVVLDPFMGSGTTPLAAKNNNRNYIGIEINEDIYNISVERLNNVEKLF